MSANHTMRRADRQMSEEEAWTALKAGFWGTLATVSRDGMPYATPLLYIVWPGEIIVHGGAAPGHLRTNIDHNPLVCFQTAEAGEVYAYGRTACDSSVAYRSVIAFGRAALAADAAIKKRFCDDLMSKYGPAESGQPDGVYPRLDHITVYRIAVARISGKNAPLPPLAQRWPAAGLTRSPDAPR